MSIASYLKGLPRLPVSDSIDWLGWFNNLQTIGQDVSTSGATADRPTNRLYVGKPFFDTTLGKPIWLKSASPVTWVDATGAAV